MRCGPFLGGGWFVSFDGLRHAGRRRVGRLHHLGNVDRLRRIRRLSMTSGWASSARLAHLDRLAHVGGLIHRRGLRRLRLLRRVGRLQIGIVGHQVLHAAAARHRRGLRADIDFGPQAEHVAGVAGGDRQDCRDQPAAQHGARRENGAHADGSRREAARQTRNMDPSKTQNRFKDSGQQ